MEKIRKIMKAAGDMIRKYPVFLLLMFVALFIAYTAFSFTAVDLTLISGQAYETSCMSGLTLKHNDDLSEISEGNLTAVKAGFDRFLILSPGRTDYIRLNVLERYDPGNTDIEGCIGDGFRIRKYGNVMNVFESSDSNVAAVDDSGSLYLNNSGKCNITQTINGFQKVIYAVSVKSPELVIEPSVIYKGGTARATVLYLGSIDTDIRFSAAGENIEVKQDVLPAISEEDMPENVGALITGREAGKAEVTVHINQTELKGPVTVMDDPFIKEQAALYIGDRKALDVENVADKAELSFVSSDEDVIRVEDGLLVPVAPGRCTVTARIRDRECSLDLDIPEPKILCESSYMAVGDTVRFKAEGLSRDAEWESSDTGVLSIDKSGQALCNGPGRCRVTASAGDYSVGMDVEVDRAFYGAERIPSELPDGVRAMLSCIFYYEECLQKDIGLGRKWQYSNHGWASNFFKPFDTIDSGADGYRSCNCDSSHQWVVQDIEGAKSYKGIADFYSGGPSLKSLMNAGKVRPGDIFLGYRVDESGKHIGHSWIYVGDGVTFDTGHGSGGWHSDGSIAHTDPRQAVFDTWLHPTTSSFTYTGYTITKHVRLKDSYTPKRYRNSDGDLVNW